MKKDEGVVFYGWAPVSNDEAVTMKDSLIDGGATLYDSMEELLSEAPLEEDPMTDGQEVHIYAIRCVRRTVNLKAKLS